VSRETVERAAKYSSMVINGFDGDRQIGYCRIVSDRTTFAWVCDVYVEEEFRGQGFAREMVSVAMEDPEHQGLRRWLLATKDAHGVYERIGFEPLVEPARWMVRH
jgi:GNAT superfamily N-acetyltransferase